MARQQTVNRGNMKFVKEMFVGQSFKSYRDLCRWLGADILGGDSKNYQLKEWGRYFRWEQVKHSYVIKEVFSEPRELPWFETEEDHNWVAFMCKESDKNEIVKLLKENGFKTK
jgi:hypothetical protein